MDCTGGALTGALGLLNTAGLARLGATLALLLATACSEPPDPPEPCATGTWDHDTDAATACIDWTTCAPGEQVASQGTPTSDRSCSACAAGTYSVQDNATGCSAWTECVSGESVTSEGTATADRTCAPCAVGTFSTTTNATTCSAHRDCPAGERVVLDGSATEDRVCAACPSGAFSETLNAGSCTNWGDCVAGEYVATAGTTTNDRVCMQCITGTYTSGPNQSSCVPLGACAPGTLQTAAGTMTAPPVCDACSAGEYCAGDTAPVVLCDDGDDTWDDDASPTTACVPRSTCVPGQVVNDDGDATTDRACATCADGTFSDTDNASTCAPWDDCMPGEYASAPGDRTNDRECTACLMGTFSTEQNANACIAWQACRTGYVEATPGSDTADRTCVLDGWVREFGTTANERVHGMAIDAAGNIVVAGYTAGGLAGMNAGGEDAFVAKLDALGNVLWIRQFGTDGTDAAYDVYVATSGDIVVAGYTSGDLEGVNAGGTDAFVRKYDSDGVVVWTRQFGTTENDRGFAVAADASGNVLVAGSTRGALDGTAANRDDGFVRKYDTNGNALWTRQIRSAGLHGEEYARVVRADSMGNVIVTGDTDGTVGAARFGSADIFVRKYNASGTVLWTHQFGADADERVESMTVDGSDNILLAGSTFGNLSTGASGDSLDAYVQRYDASGAVLWTRQFGTSSDDGALSVSVDASGDARVLGTTSGALSGAAASSSGRYIRRYSAAGVLGTTWQFFLPSHERTEVMASTPTGEVLLAGRAVSTVDHTTTGGDDALVRLVLVP